MAATHSVTVADGTADLTMTWGPDGGQAVAQGDDKPVEITLSRQEAFAMWQFFGTVLNCIADAEGED